MSSKADDFDVRYRDAGTAEHGRPAADGGYRSNAGNVDYDLGYDSPGWDTQGFRRPEAGFADGHESGQSRDMERGGVGTAVRLDHRRAPGARREGNHARVADPAAETGEATQLNWETEATGSLFTPGLPTRGRRASRGPARAAGPGGPGGPRRPRGPRGLGGPGRRGVDRARVKVKGSWWRHWTLRKALGVLLGLVGGFVVLGAVAVAVAYEETPVPTAALAATSFMQSVVYSSNGTLIGRLGTTNRQMLQYNQIPPKMINAVVAAEDRNFFNEGGISPTGIMRAAYEDLTGSDGSLQGGSTITQEFVRQYYSGIGTQQTLTRKIKEIFVAMKVAKEKSKQWILTNYLNTIYLGQGAYGIEAAAQTYYGKPVAQLTAAQDAVIAAIIQQPSTYPLAQYRPQLEARWHYVLNGMVQTGTLTAQQAAAMKFPVPGNHVAQTVGRDVWDPYVLAMVQTELHQVYHLSMQQIYNGGYVIRTTVDNKKMAALYQAVRDNEAQINASSHPFHPSYMHAGAVLEDPGSGAIQAVYGGPGFPGAPYNGTGKVITTKLCNKIRCQWNMAVQNPEQVGSSFKPYVLAAAVKAGMNVQTSTLNGFNNLYIAPDSAPKEFSTTTPVSESHKVQNDSAAENGPYTPQMAMAVSINTAYADLWHRVGGAAVASMAQELGVNTNRACITAPCPGNPNSMEHEAGVALGQASLTVLEQASMLATIDNGGVYHSAHIISSIGRVSNAPSIPVKVTSYPVFSSNPTMNSNEASQVQYAMSEDDAPYGTAPGAAMSNGQEIIAKTGTTDSAQSAFFIGAIPSQTLAVALFTDEQGSKNGMAKETLDMLGGLSQGGMGGTWPAAIWHTYAEDQFVPLGVEPFPAPVFTGATWNQVPPGLRIVPKKPKKHDHGGNGDHNGNGNGNGNGNPSPWPTYSCDPTVVTCQPTSGGGGNGNGGGGPLGGVPAGAGLGAVVIALPLWARRRRQQRASGQCRKSGPGAN